MDSQIQLVITIMLMYIVTIMFVFVELWTMELYCTHCTGQHVWWSSPTILFFVSFAHEHLNPMVGLFRFAPFIFQCYSKFSLHGYCSAHFPGINLILFVYVSWIGPPLLVAAIITWLIMFIVYFITETLCYLMIIFVLTVLPLDLMR